MMTEYFFDTYAFVEIFNKNPSYERFVHCRIHISKLNLFEIYYTLLRKHGEDVARPYLHDFMAFVVDFDIHIIMAAAKIKLQNRQISMTDAIGYALAKQLGVKFLTGDEAFEKLPNVEFVK